jgi:hypothetical protein
MMPTARLDAAITLAREIHHGQTRKGTNIAYLSHLLGVASLVMEHGGTEDQVIAHDYGVLGDALRERFSASSEESSWYYRSLADVYAQRLGDHPLCGELQIAIDRIWG